MIKLCGYIKKNNQTKYYFLLVPVFKKVLLHNKILVYFLGAKIFQRHLKQNLSVKLKTNTEKSILVIDHSLGGGTETYFNENIKNLSEKNYLLRLQAIQSGYYKLSTFDKEAKTEMYLENLNEVETLLSELKKVYVIINSLVGYENISAIFDLTAKFGNKTRVNVHDYYSICQNIFLLTKENKFCDVSSTSKCGTCLSRPINEWRKLWLNFYSNHVDDIIVFSQSSKNILTKAYPNLEPKIKVEPHTIKEFKKTQAITQQKKADNTLNIGILGDITAIHKGKNILTEMNSLIKAQRLKNIKITVIGSYNKKNSIKVTGKYAREDLPDLLAKYKIDVVFIPSICSETYSYTASEAMTLNMPVACFNIGAPGERVKEYEKGLIVSKIDAETALKEIIAFSESLVKN